jgi:hypothetical protein
MSTAILGTSHTEFRPIPFPRRATPAPLHLTRRGRLVIGALVLVPLLGGIVAVAAVGMSAVATDTTSVTEFDYITVAAGETLWQLAESIAPESDPRDVIADIVGLNNLSSSAVQAGQQLAIPTAYSD